MDIGEHETEIIITAVIGLTIAVVTKSIDMSIYSGLMGMLMGYSFHAIPAQQAAAKVT